MQKSNKNLNAWIAGFWEGEGSLIKTECGYTISLPQAINTRRTVLSTMRLFPKFFKGKIYYYKPKNPRHRIQIKWLLHKRAEVIYFLNAILPYCLLRKAEILIALEFFKNTKFKHYRDFSSYLPEIKKYLKKKYTYQKISQTLNYEISDTTICRLISKELK